MVKRRRFKLSSSGRANKSVCALCFPTPLKKEMPPPFLIPGRILPDLTVQIVINGLDLGFENPDDLLDSVFDLRHGGSG